MLAISARALRPAVKCEISIRKWELGTRKWGVGSRKLVRLDWDWSKTMSGMLIQSREKMSEIVSFQIVFRVRQVFLLCLLPLPPSDFQ